jgi:hypothetical protein
MDQFGEMNKTKLAVHVETSRSGASGKGTILLLSNQPHLTVIYETPQ